MQLYVNNSLFYMCVIRPVSTMTIGCVTSSTLDTWRLQDARCRSRWRTSSPSRRRYSSTRLANSAYCSFSTPGRTPLTTAPTAWRLPSNTRSSSVLVLYLNFCSAPNEGDYIVVSFYPSWLAFIEYLTEYLQHYWYTLWKIKITNGLIFKMNNMCTYTVKMTITSNNSMP